MLFAFHQACKQPSAEDILEWTSRYPQFADDIRADAAVARDWAAREGLPVRNRTRPCSRVVTAAY